LDQIRVAVLAIKSANAKRASGISMHICEYLCGPFSCKRVDFLGQERTLGWAYPLSSLSHRTRWFYNGTGAFEGVNFLVGCEQVFVRIFLQAARSRKRGTIFL
jgi:hypothetical protein